MYYSMIIRSHSEVKESRVKNTAEITPQWDRDVGVKNDVVICKERLARVILKPLSKNSG